MEDNYKKTVKEAATNANSEQLDMIDVTVLSKPRPTASSTVARKPFLGRQYLNDSPDDNCKRILLNETIDRKNINDSSLGILDNISSLLSDSGTTESSKIKNNIDTERQLARKLLERCSERQTSNSTTQANSGNVSSIQNQATDNTPSTLIDSVHQTLFGSSQSNASVSTLPAAISSANSMNIVFEPAEITARSSGMSNSQEKSIPSNSIASSAGFSFNSGAAELMAKFENEDFLSGSQAGSRMLADEVSFQQNCSYALPRTTNNEEERLELSCFSGIIGDLDLSLESCAGRKVSIGEFFKRKCEKMGQLSEVESIERPSFGATITSPKRLGNRMPLVDVTLQTETSSVYKSDDSPKPTLNSSEAQKKHSLMSLSTIAQALKDIDDATPRRLVDELLMAKKKRNKCSENKLNKAEIVQSATYTLLPSTRQSMPTTPTIQNEKLEKNSPSFNEPERFSLDSRMIGDDVIPHETAPSKISFSSHLDYNSHVTPQLSEAISENKKRMEQSIAGQNIFVKSSPEPVKENNMPVRSTSLQLESLLQGSYLENLSREKKAVSTLERKESTDNRAGKIVDAEGRIKEQESSVSDVKLESSTISQQQNFKVLTKSNKDAVTVKNTELCSCIVGVPGETELELSNKGDRWIMCTFSLNETDGIKDKIELRLPSEKILIEPNARRTVKVKVKVPRMDKSLTVPMDLRISDMVTHSNWSIRHTMCFVPEEPHLTVLTHSGNKELNFQLVAENSQKSLPVTVENKNNVDLPVKLYISQTGPKLFSIDNSLNETITPENESGDIKCLTLASRQQYTTNILFKGTALTSFDSSTSEKGLHHIIAHFVVEVHTGNGNGQVLQKFPLIGYIGTCKIEAIDTPLPIIIPRRESKPLNLINSGTVPVLLKATVVESDNMRNLNSDFRVTPDNLFIQIGERVVFMITHKPSTDTPDRYAVVKVLAGSDVYFYPVVGEEISKSEQANDNLLRSETPQHLDAMGSPSSPHSPHSVALNRSRNSGRNSPSSSVSSIPVSGSVIPIRATHAALVWGSVKAGKSDTKELTIRNMSDNKIKLQAIIVDNEKNFKFLKERQTTGSSMILALQRMESRTLSIIFGPTNPGACAGKITFRHYEARKNSGNSCP
ncbi:uncharacterized protein LOC107274266 [Cephus cinctus]|uniref:Uncharacterized protein LOC107274266 n=1 Tax=Cephus cinctus TaxID=211228 RepID=A0AAJ7CFU2_CEPCN|nr:uncharacterized protein LOC107274266 [Cephus cinctus]